MTAQPTLPRTQLLVYEFGPDADFEGRIVGALERMEGGGALRVLDGLFVANDPETGGLVATSLGREGAGGVVAPLLSFRLEPSERRRATERALAEGGVPAEAIRELGSELEPGAAMVAVLVEHVWAQALADAVSRTGGTALVSDFVDATALKDLAPLLVAAVGSARAGPPTE